MRTSFRRGGLTSWPGIGRPSLGGACGKEGLQLTATEFRLSLLHHLKVKFSSHGRRSQSTINRDGELFAWTPLPHDAVEKPRPLGPARCSWGYCTWGRRANKEGGEIMKKRKTSVCSNNKNHKQTKQPLVALDYQRRLSWSHKQNH